MSEDTSETYDRRLAAMKADTAFMTWLNDYFGGDGSWDSEYSGTWFSLHDAWTAGKEKAAGFVDSHHDD